MKTKLTVELEVSERERILKRANHAVKNNDASYLIQEINRLINIALNRGIEIGKERGYKWL